jgi:anti-sigma regulatory factor (Ser/Thr protein kinase)
MTVTRRRGTVASVLWRWTAETDCAPAQARRALRCALDQLGFPQPVIEDAVLAAGELVANAVEHGVGPYELRLRRKSGGELLCEVEDHDPHLPAIPQPRRPVSSDVSDLQDLDALCAALEERGRGLQIVDRLSQGRWGFRRASGPAKVAWMVLPR